MRIIRQSFVATFVSLVLLLLPLTSFAQASKTFTKVTPGSSTALRVAAGDASRSSVLVQNIGSVNVAFGGSVSITYATGTVVTPNQQILCVGDTDGLWAIAQSSTADLRVISTFSQGTRPAVVPSCTVSRLNTTGITNTAAATTFPVSDGSNIGAGNVLFFNLSAAITPNSTTTSTTAGTLAITSNATGLGSVFQSDGTKWQLLAFYSAQVTKADEKTVATTGNTDAYVIAPEAGTLVSADFSAIDALAASDSNFITFSITNLGQAGGGSTAMLAASDANTTKSTGGTALSANTKRSLTVHGTGANLIVAKGDRLRIRYAATGTLVGTVTGSVTLLRFTRLS